MNLAGFGRDLKGTKSILLSNHNYGRTVFITGARGFIGKALVSCFLANRAWQIKALVRHPIQERALEAPRFTLVTGDLLEPVSYTSSLIGVDTVIHLAAVTGKAAPSQYERANIEGTSRLLEACKLAGVQRFLNVSTIAVKYADQRHYPYARTKARAEALVRDSGIPNATIRPTIVIGAASPIWRTLSRIAKLPIIPMPNGARVQLQPIDVDDLVRGIELALSDGRFEGEVLELGGPASISFADLIRAIHKAHYNKAPRLVPVPLTPIRTLLALSEPLLRPLLPVTAGQLTIFANDGTVTSNWLHDRLKGQMLSVEESIARLVAEEVSLNASAVGS